MREWMRRNWALPLVIMLWIYCVVIMLGLWPTLYAQTHAQKPAEQPKAGEQTVQTGGAANSRIKWSQATITTGTWSTAEVSGHPLVLNLAKDGTVMASEEMVPVLGHASPDVAVPVNIKCDPPKPDAVSFRNCKVIPMERWAEKHCVHIWPNTGATQVNGTSLHVRCTPDKEQK